MLCMDELLFEKHIEEETPSYSTSQTILCTGRKIAN